MLYKYIYIHMWMYNGITLDTQSYVIYIYWDAQSACEIPQGLPQLYMVQYVPSYILFIHDLPPDNQTWAGQFPIHS